MADLDETPTWEPVYELEVDDDALGGPGGVMNEPTQNLAHRTAYLKYELERIEAISALAFMGHFQTVI